MRVWATAGEGQRPGAEGEGGEVAPHPVRRRAVVRDAVPVAVVQHGQRLPPGEAERHEGEHDGQGGQRRAAPAAATTAPRPGPRRRGAPAAAARRTTSRSSRAAARRGPTSRRCDGTAAHGQRGDAPGGDRGEHRVGRDALPDRGRARAPGTARRAGPPTRRPGRAAVTSTATAVVAAISGDDQPGREPAAEPEPVQQHEEHQRARRVAGDVHRPVVRLGVVAGSGSTYSRSVAGRSVVARAVCRYSYGCVEDARRSRRRRRRARARASTPARRRTPPPAAGARTAAPPGRPPSAPRATPSTSAGSGARADARVPLGVQRREASARARPSR